MDIVEQTLFIDPQAQVPACYCPVCGGACYKPSLICLRCERRKRHDVTGTEPLL